MLTTVGERVARGAAWLDRNVPGWLNRINSEKLSLRSGCNCILGQLYHTFWDAPSQLQEEAVKFGFDASANNVLGIEFEELDEAWLSLIMSRRQA